MSQRIEKLTNGKIQIKTDGKISKSLQCNVSYIVAGTNELILEDTTGTRASLFADQVNYTQLQPAAAVAQTFVDAQEMADFLDANFFAG